MFLFLSDFLFLCALPSHYSVFLACSSLVVPVLHYAPCHVMFSFLSPFFFLSVLSLFSLLRLHFLIWDSLLSLYFTSAAPLFFVFPSHMLYYLLIQLLFISGFFFAVPFVHFNLSHLYLCISSSFFFFFTSYALLYYFLLHFFFFHPFFFLHFFHLVLNYVFLSRHFISSAFLFSFYS